MKSLLFPLSLLCALVATGGLAYVAMRAGDHHAASQQEPNREGPGHDASGENGTSSEPRLRRYQTTATLVEDLRDALADPALLKVEVWRVSRAIKSKARWSLANLVPSEASPRVRALLTLSTGCHHGESELVIGLFRDAAPVVRQAAVLACGYRPDGKIKSDVLGVSVTIGRALSERSTSALYTVWRTEKDASVRDAVRAVLEAAGQPLPN